MYDQMPPEVWIPLGIILWTATIIVLVRERRRARKGKQN